MNDCGTSAEKNLSLPPSQIPAARSFSTRRPLFIQEQVDLTYCTARGRGYIHETPTGEEGRGGNMARIVGDADPYLKWNKASAGGLGGFESLQDDFTASGLWIHFRGLKLLLVSRIVQHCGRVVYVNTQYRVREWM